MTLDGWRECVSKTANDPEMLELVAQMLHEHDTAKQLLRNAGYGVTGVSLVDTVREALADVEPL